MNIFCANCENECSESATACPKCGHPLGAPMKDVLSDRDLERLGVMLIKERAATTTFDAIHPVVLRIILAVLLSLFQIAIAVGVIVGVLALLVSVCAR